MDLEFKKKVFFIVKVFLVILALATSVFYAPDVFLLIFAGILVSIFLRSLSNTLTEYSGIPEGWSLGFVILVLIALFSVTSYFAAPSIAEQFDQLVRRIPESLERLRGQIEGYSWGRSLLSEAQPENILGESRRVMSGVGGAFSSLLGWMTNFVVILFIGLYGAIQPGVYKRGFLQLIPIPQRRRIAEVMSAVSETLKWWLIGKFADMAFIGILTTIGLWLLEVPLAFMLGLIAALFTFIPNIGPLLAAAPAILLGLSISPQLALYVGVLYTLVQMIESYILTPLIQRKTINLPPALTLATQVLLGVSLGGLGVALATPLTAALLVITKMLYVEDGLS